MGVLRASLVLAALLAANGAVSGEVLRHGRTGAEFPATVSFAHEGRDYRLEATGTAVRRILFFDVYTIAHYAEPPVPAVPTKTSSLPSVS